MPEPTPSQLKIDGMPETEIVSLRVAGNLAIAKGCDLTFEDDFYKFLNSTSWLYSHDVSIGPDDESGMRLYRVEEVEAKDKQISVLQRSVLDWQITNDENQKLFKTLSEQLRQEKEKYQKLYKSFILLDGKSVSQDRTIGIQADTIAALELRLKVKDSPIKAGLKRIWKWFKSTVNQ